MAKKMVFHRLCTFPDFRRRDDIRFPPFFRYTDDRQLPILVISYQ
jgi:hypothetical protein